MRTVLLPFIDQAADTFTGSNGHGRFGHNDFVVKHMVSDRGGGGINEAEIWRPIVFGRGTNSKIDDECLFDGFGDIDSESQTAGLRVFSNELFKPRLVNGHYAVLEPFNFLLVDIDTRDIDAELSKTGTRYEAYITRTDNRDMHWNLMEAY